MRFESAFEVVKGFSCYNGRASLGHSTFSWHGSEIHLGPCLCRIRVADGLLNSGVVRVDFVEYQILWTRPNARFCTPTGVVGTNKKGLYSLPTLATSSSPFSKNV